MTPPARRPEGSMREKRPGVWEIAVARGRRADGKPRRVYRTVYGSRLDAERAVSALSVELGGSRALGDPMTLRAFWETVYWPAQSKRLAPTTLRAYRVRWETGIAPALGDIDLTDLRPYEVEAWVAGMADRPTFAHDCYRTLRAALKTALKWQLVDSIATDGVTGLPRAERRELTPYSASEVHCILDALGPSPLGAVFAVTACGGLRKEEAVPLERSDLAFVGWDVYVTVSKAQPAGAPVGPCKTPESRRTAIVTGRAADLLADYLAGRDWLYLTGEAAPRSPSALSADWRAWCKRHGVRHVPLGKLRHTYATLAQSAGVDGTLIAAMLGHTQVGTTYAHYLRPSPETFARAASEVAAAIG